MDLPLRTVSAADEVLCRMEVQAEGQEMHRRSAHLKDVDGGLVDGAGDGAAGVNNVAHHAHYHSRRPGIQP